MTNQTKCFAGANTGSTGTQGDVRPLTPGANTGSVGAQEEVRPTL
jgi:hypothetical protein